MTTMRFRELENKIRQCLSAAMTSVVEIRTPLGSPIQTYSAVSKTPFELAAEIMDVIYADMTSSLTRDAEKEARDAQ